MIRTFEDMNLNEDILRGVYAYGFEQPSEIQNKGIEPMISGKDIIAQSQSGTGKTGTFVIGSLQLIDYGVKGCQIIVVAPTRELAIQIQQVFKSIGGYTKAKTVLCIGGSNIQDAKKQMQGGSIIVIGTPGRIIDMLNRGYISTKTVKALIMDEADEILSTSFSDQMRTIVTALPQDSQICLFSATMPRELFETTNKFMNNPMNILVKKEQLTLEGIKQFYINTQQENWKFETFCDIYNVISIAQSIVYVNTKKRAHELQDKLKNNNFTVSVIHGLMKPTERSAIMKQFRNGESRILVSTDLLSRGIDIQQVSIVINYDLPPAHNKECYIHRIGRSGRYGRKGVAINLVTDRDFSRLRDLERFYGTKIDEMPVTIDEFIT